MTLKLLILYRFSTETAVGKIRREASKSKSLFQMLSGYKGAIRKIFASRGTIFAIIISVLVEIVSMIMMTFWQIIASLRIGVHDTLLPIFPMIRSVLSILLFFTIISRINQAKLKWPLYGGFVSAIIGSALLISIPSAGVLGYILLSASLLLEALGSAVLHTIREALVAIYADPEERSAIMAILQTVVMLISVPFGYIAGLLSDISKVLPFVLCIALLLLGILGTSFVLSQESLLTKPTYTSSLFALADPLRIICVEVRYMEIQFAALIPIVFVIVETIENSVSRKTSLTSLALPIGIIVSFGVIPDKNIFENIVYGLLIGFGAIGTCDTICNGKKVINGKRKQRMRIG